MKKDLKDIVNYFNLPMKDFTALLNNFYKENWWRYSFELNLIDASFIYIACTDFLDDKKNTNISKYNAMRVIKLTLCCEDKDFFRQIFKPTLAFILGYSTHDYWNFRMESINILSELKFRTTINAEPWYWRKMTKKIMERYKYYWPILVEFYFLLQKKDLDYQEINKNSLDFLDLSRDGYIPYSWDTKNKSLKYFRRAMEELDSPYFEKKMKEFWFVKK